MTTIKILDTANSTNVPISSQKAEQKKVLNI